MSHQRHKQSTRCAFLISPFVCIFQICHHIIFSTLQPYARFSCLFSFFSFFRQQLQTHEHILNTHTQYMQMQRPETSIYWQYNVVIILKIEGMMLKLKLIPGKRWKKEHKMPVNKNHIFLHFFFFYFQTHTYEPCSIVNQRNSISMESH